MAGRRRVPSPPARIAALSSCGSAVIRWTSGCVLARGAPFHAVAFEQFLDAVVQRPSRLEARLAQPLVRHDVIPLVRVLADRREVDVEVRYVLLHLERQLFL